MYRLCVFLALTVATCYGAPDQPICRGILYDLSSCVDIKTSTVSAESVAKCRNAATKAQITECEGLTCVFSDMKLLDGAVVNDERTAALFDNYVKEYPVWSSAMEHVKASCLGSTGLKPYPDCPVLNVVHCMRLFFFKYAPASQWSTSPSCSRLRAIVAACPICPDECYASQAPIDSCNACLSVRL